MKIRHTGRGDDLVVASTRLPGLRRKRTFHVIASGLVLVLVSSWLVYQRVHDRNAQLPLLSSVVAIGAGGQRQLVLPHEEVRFFPGTRVLAAPSNSTEAQRQEEWLASGVIPGEGGPYQELARRALIDLDVLTLPSGASVAAWPEKWRYVWPRDASFVAVALARTGHQDEAIRILEFLQSVQPDSGEFQARYLPSGVGPPDDRGEESDGIGWVLWATLRVSQALPNEPSRVEVRSRLAGLIARSTSAALRLTARPDAMPPPSMDYWEVESDRLSLGTAAPLALGLEAASQLARQGDDSALADLADARARHLRASIRSSFAPDGYPRYLQGKGSDASLAFLLPPFVSAIEPGVKAAWVRAGREMARPAGGLAPGVKWKQDGVSWTPETALFALTAASVGDRAVAERLLSWLAAHCTTYGSVPEKVLSDGSPAGPAPLAWSDALILLVIDALNPESRAPTALGTVSHRAH